MKSVFGCNTSDADQWLSGPVRTGELVPNDACNGRKDLSDKFAIERLSSSSPVPVDVDGRILDPEKTRLRVESVGDAGPVEKPLLRESGEGGTLSIILGGKDGLRVVDEAMGRRG